MSLIWRSPVCVEDSKLRVEFSPLSPFDILKVSYIHVYARGCSLLILHRTYFRIPHYGVLYLWQDRTSPIGRSAGPFQPLTPFVYYSIFFSHSKCLLSLPPLIRPLRVSSLKTALHTITARKYREAQFLEERRSVRRSGYTWLRIYSHILESLGCHFRTK